MEASRFEVKRVIRITRQDIIGFPVGDIIEIPYEIGTVCIRLHRETKRTEGHFIGSNIVLRCRRYVRRLETCDIIGLRVEVLDELRINTAEVQILSNRRAICSSDIQIPRTTDTLPLYERTRAIRSNLIQRYQTEALRSIQTGIINEEINTIGRLLRQMEDDLSIRYSSRIEIQRVVTEEIILL